MDKKLYRSRNNRMIAGVCGGIAEYFNIDPTIIRIIWAILCIYGIGILAYIIAVIVIPEGNYEDYGQGSYNVNVNGKTVSLVIGIALILIGVLILGRHLMPSWISKFFWPTLLIAVGALIIFKGGGRNNEK